MHFKLIAEADLEINFNIFYFSRITFIFMQCRQYRYIQLTKDIYKIHDLFRKLFSSIYCYFHIRSINITFTFFVATPFLDG